MIRIRKIPGWLALGVILVLAGGCGGDAPARIGAAGEDGPPVSGGSAIVTTSADMTVPVAMLAQGMLDGNLGADILFRELLRGAWEDGRLIYQTADESPMAIARRYEFLAPDSTSVRFHLRSDVRWSDGVPMTARDVEFSYRIVGEPELASPLQSYAQSLERVQVEDDSTVVFHFAHRYPEMLTHSALPLLPAHVFGDTPPGEIRDHPTLRNPENGNLVVSGPFMIGSWQRGQQITLVRNPQFEPAAHLDQIVIRIIPDPTTRLVELQTGSVDMVTGITYDQVPRLRAQAPHVRLELEEKRFYDYVAYNGERFAPFADPEVRRALGLAIDARSIIRALLMDEFAVPAGGPYAPIFRDLHDPEGQAPLPHDPDEARRILAERGWRDSTGDGVLDLDGQPFSFTLVTNTGNQRRADVSQILQQQWSRIGVAARIQLLEFNTLQANLLSGNYEAVLGGWSVSLSPDLATLWAPESPFNYTQYRNAEVQSLIEQAMRQPSYERAVPLWREAASGIARDQPYTWLYYLDAVDGVNNRLRGARIDTYGSFQNTWEWWIPRSEQ